MVEKKGLPAGLSTLTADHAGAAAHAGAETKAVQLSPAVNAATPLRHFVRLLNGFIPLPPTARCGYSPRLPAQAQHDNRSASRSYSLRYGVPGTTPKAGPSAAAAKRLKQVRFASSPTHALKVKAPPG
jgi:hypothetical protein